jgi:hypothetical protein
MRDRAEITVRAAAEYLHNNEVKPGRFQAKKKRARKQRKIKKTRKNIHSAKPRDRFRLSPLLASLAEI